MNRSFKSRAALLALFITSASPEAHAGFGVGRPSCLSTLSAYHGLVEALRSQAEEATIACDAASTSGATCAVARTVRDAANYAASRRTTLAAYALGMVGYGEAHWALSGVEGMLGAASSRGAAQTDGWHRVRQAWDAVGDSVAECEIARRGG
jgi:hypothetical protein